MKLFMNGEFLGKVPIIKIDGFTTGPIEEGDDNRFALGSIPNQNRLPEVEQVRRTIGTGVELVYECGKVSIKNMSRGNHKNAQKVVTRLI